MNTISPLKVSDNRRYLIHEDGQPFFYLGDTAWEIFHRLTREEADLYLADRATKGFTVVQAVVLSEINGLDDPNAYGDRALHDFDPTRPNEAYFRHVDYVLQRANELGLYVGLLPTWGAYAVEEKHVLFPDHFILTPETAYPYGRFLGERYRDLQNLIWILGGDRKPTGYEETWRAMAKGIAEGVCGREDYSGLTMTYHPWGGASSGDWLHDEPWLTFNMIQSGHHADSRPWEKIARDYARTPTKPVLNGEPAYEQIPNNLKNESKLGDYYVRKFAYTSLFAGACGHTYGANELWQMWKPENDPVSPVLKGPLLGADTLWSDALQYPGAHQMTHVRALMESHPFLTRIPAPEMVPEADRDRVHATRDSEGTYAFVYAATGEPFTVNLASLSGPVLRAAWYDPRTGTATPLEEFRTTESRAFTPPSGGPEDDWVLILDDAARDFPLPGQEGE